MSEKISPLELKKGNFTILGSDNDPRPGELGDKMRRDLMIKYAERFRLDRKFRDAIKEYARSKGLNLEGVTTLPTTFLEELIKEDIDFMVAKSKSKIT